MAAFFSLCQRVKVIVSLAIYYNRIFLKAPPGMAARIAYAYVNFYNNFFIQSEYSGYHSLYQLRECRSYIDTLSNGHFIPTLFPVNSHKASIEP